MHRLTEHIDDRYLKIKGCRALYPAKEREGAPASNAIARLAAYEDVCYDAEGNEIMTLEELRGIVSGVHGPR